MEVQGIELGAGCMSVLDAKSGDDAEDVRCMRVVEMSLKVGDDSDRTDDGSIAGTMGAGVVAANG